LSLPESPAVASRTDFGGRTDRHPAILYDFIQSKIRSVR
jgi:hypothetical protein